jgi:hypothetical protein
MEAETKQCQNCKKDFTIEPEDFNFYEKIKVSPPTWCPECRFQRRLVWRNERSLYHLRCKLCGKSVVSMYFSDKFFPVYCTDCWWSDKWDSSWYAKDYDFSRSFFEQFKELMLSVPHPSLIQRDIVNSPYTNWPMHVKNSYLVFGGHDIEDSSYISLRSHFLKNCVDVSYSYSSELCYECANVSKCYMLSFSQDCEACHNSMFLYNCRNCSDCFGCVGLRSKQYHIFNKPYSKEKYLQEIEKMDVRNYKSLKNLREQFLKLMISLPKKYAMILQSVNVTGDDIAKAKNCHNCFSVSLDMEDCKYLWLVDRTKDVYDMSIGYSMELGYEGLSILEGRNMRMSTVSWVNHDVTYVDNCHDCGNLFACVGLRNKQYCILNKQYTKEEYEEMIPKIIKHMNDMPYKDSKGRIYKYGEFFPSELSPFSYNETIAQEYFPLTKGEALKQGYKWKEREERNYQIDIKNEDIPNDIKEVKDDIIGKVIECEHQGTCNEQCTEAFKIIPDELSFYKRMNLPLPHFCPNCRHYQRLKQRNPLKLWHRHCMKLNCPNEFETSYAPDRPEIVYCERCYQQEVY